MTDVTITSGARLAGFGLLILTLIVGGGNLWATHSEIHAAQAAQQQEQAAQRKQGEQELRTLCSTFGRLGDLRPPPGAPGKNPSRKYLQTQHDILAQISIDLRCQEAGL